MTAPELPEEMVRRLAYAVAKREDWEVGEMDLRQARDDLTAAGVPELIAERDRLFAIAVAALGQDLAQKIRDDRS